MNLNKEQFKQMAEMSLKNAEKSLNEQINGLVSKLERLLNETKNIIKNDPYIADRAGRILHEVSWSVANLNIDAVIRNVSEYRAAEIRMETIKDYETAK